MMNNNNKNNNNNKKKKKKRRKKKEILDLPSIATGCFSLTHSNFLTGHYSA